MLETLKIFDENETYDDLLGFYIGEPVHLESGRMHTNASLLRIKTV